MDTFNERMSRLNELSPEELEELIEEMVTAFEAADSAGDLDTMQALADALDNARAQLATVQGEEQPAAPVEEEAPMAASASVTEDDAPAEDAGDAPAASEEDAPAAQAPDQPSDDAVASDEEAASEVGEPEAGDEPAETPIEPGADAPEPEETPVDTITAEDVPAENQPSPEAAEPVISITAGGDIPGVTAGTAIQDMDEVVELMTKKVNSMRGISGDGEHIIVASMRTVGDLPEERILKPGDAAGNGAKIRALLQDREALTREALVAAAWCAPRAPIYDVPTVGVTDRPVAGALPTFNADRGGATWMQPPALPDVTDAVALWVYDEDDSRWESRTMPDGTGTSALTKPSLLVECGSEQYADVRAVTQSLCFDNMTARAFPEWIRGNTDLTLVSQARFAEQALLADIFGSIAAGDCGTPGTALGAARDFLVVVKTAAAAKRWRFRLGADAPLQLLAPSWLREVIAIDLNIQAPGDDTLTTTYAEIDGYLTNANIDPVWFIDDAPGTDVFDSCATFPAEVHWMLYPTGTFIRLDNGELDLGVVRSKEDISKNQYCQFAETFETAAYMGPASPNEWATHGVTPIEVLGSTGAPTEITAGS